MALKIFGALILAALLIAGCQRSPESWTVYGQVFGKNSLQPIADQPLIVRRFRRDPWWCPFCRTTRDKVATVRTDSTGRYEFTSNRPGIYGIDGISEKNKYCSISVGLGSMTHGKRRVDLAMRENSCYLIY